MSARYKVKIGSNWLPRDPRYHPFRSSSVWNTPMGNSATFEASGATKTANLINPAHGAAWVNRNEFSFPIYRAKKTDPTRSVTPSQVGIFSRFRAPIDATPAVESDKHIVVIDPEGRWSQEGWIVGVGTQGTATWTANRWYTVDLYGDGFNEGGSRASNASGLGGLIRERDIENGVIPHALALSVWPASALRGWVWPATGEDDVGITYSGQNPLGTFCGIPSSVNINSLGLNTYGLMIAKALQDYGAYIVDTGGSFCFYVEETSPNSASAVASMRTNMDTIRSQIRVVTNSGSSAIGGPGTRRVAATVELPDMELV